VKPVVAIPAGPVIRNGVLVFTALRDLHMSELLDPASVMRPDGTSPKRGESLTDAERQVWIDTMGKREWP
jgi:hypothetical protein